MKKGLFILFSDNINLSLINLYKRMSKDDFKIDCYAARCDALSLHAFENVDGIKWISELSSQVLRAYEFIICGRNCFDCCPPDLLIDYPGIIFTDNTAFYEGRNVFGDIVFVNGQSNLTNLKQNIDFNTYIVGCLKGLSINKEGDSVWQTDREYENNILYIESGHYPFGEKGRITLAKGIANLVTQNPRSLFIVKPRFLLGEATNARHRNEDYLYFYLRARFENHWPENLIWLNQYYSIGELLKEADVVMHTYSSAHSEAVIQQKKIINIVDVPSEETADFRVNRFNMIKIIIDKACNNMSISNLAGDVLKAKKAEESYFEFIGGGYDDPAKAIIDIVNNPPHIHYEDRRKRRLRGYFYKIISELENRFDNYAYFIPLVKQSFSYIDEKFCDTEECISYVNQKKFEFGYKYIRENWQRISENAFDRAYALRLFLENKDYFSIKKMLEDSYRNGECDATFLCFEALSLCNEHKYAEAKIYAKKYIEHINNIKYERLDSENVNFLNLMKGILNDENSGFCTD